jgi:hypothetical protein
MTPDSFDIDIGDNHWLRWTEREGGQRIGALISHLKSDGSMCWGHIFFTPFDNHPTWEFDGNYEAPTFSPSILCRLCNDHGFIREGKWAKA